jgi:hypothetical protein
MKNTRNKYFKTICSIGIIFAITCTSSLSALAIDTTPPGGDTNTTDAIPLDGGLAILLIGAAAFGIKKLRDNKKGDV